MKVDHLKKVIGNNVKHYRRLNNQMKQKDLAQKVGKCFTWVSHIEKGNKNLTLESLVELTSALNVELLDLITPKPELITPSSSQIYTIYNGNDQLVYIGKHILGRSARHSRDSVA